MKIKKAISELFDRPKWEIHVLDTGDDATKELGNFLKNLYPKELRIVEKGEYNFSTFVDDEECLNMQKNVRNNRRLITLYGDGGLHYFTYWLCKDLDKKSDDYAYFHFDAHNDFPCPDGYMYSGGFVEAIMRHTNAKALRYIGLMRSIGYVTADENASYMEEVRNKVKNFDFRWADEIRNPEDIIPLLENTPKDAYISIDLDVLPSREIEVDCGNGLLEKDTLLKCLKIIKKHKTIKGMDICGLPFSYNKKVPRENFERALQIYNEIVRTIME